MVISSLKAQRLNCLSYRSRFSVKEICAIVSAMSAAANNSLSEATNKLAEGVVSKSSAATNLRLCSLLNKISEMDKAAFEQFYDATIKLCYSQALRITTKDDIAEEVISNVYMQVWSNAGRYDKSRSSVMTWLMMLCRSRSLDALRQRKRHLQNEVTGFDRMPDVIVDDESQDLLGATQDKGILHNALAQLKPQQRHLLSLAYFRDYSHSEIARYTELPLGTVKTQIRRAIIKLKEIIQEQHLTSGESNE